MKRMIPLILCAALAAACLSGCVAVNLSPGGVIGNGDLESYSFKVGEITEIRMEFHCDIHYYAAPSDTVTLEIQPNLREYVVVEESGGTLTVRATKNINWSSRAPVLTVSTPSLSHLRLTGAGTFTAHDPITADSFVLRLDGAGQGSAELDVGSLSVDLYGAGSFELSGKADEAEFNLSGAGNIDALPLQTRKAAVSLSGVGTVRISCSESLKIDAGGMGMVEYRGSPIVDLNSGGLVSVNKLD